MYFRNFGKFTVIPCASGFASITQQRVNRRAARVSERLTGCINKMLVQLCTQKINTIII